MWVLEFAFKISLFAGLFFGCGTPVQNWEGIIHLFSVSITLAVLAILKDVIVRNFYVVNVCHKQFKKPCLMNHANVLSTQKMNLF